MTQYYSCIEYTNRNTPIDVDKLLNDLTHKLHWGQEEVNVICTAIRESEDVLSYYGCSEACPRQQTLAEYVADVARKRGLNLDPHNLTMADWPVVVQLETEYREMCLALGFEYITE